MVGRKLEIFNLLSNKNEDRLCKHSLNFNNRSQFNQRYFDQILYEFILNDFTSLQIWKIQHKFFVKG